MICKTCGGEVPEGTRVCPFCETLCVPADQIIKEEMEKLEAASSEGFAALEQNSGGCSGCGGCGEGGGCAETGLTDASKGLKYGLFLVGLVVVVIGVAFVIKMAAVFA